MKPFGAVIVLGLLLLAPVSAKADRNWYGWSNGSRYGWNSYGWSSYGRNSYNRYGRHSFGRDFEIQQGIRNGRLSNAEVRDLIDKKRDLKRRQDQYWSDGRLTKGERNDLKKDYRDYYKDLNHQLNDGERGRGGGFFGW